MFTGLVRELGQIASVSTRGGVSVVDIRAPQTAPVLRLGDSLSVNGICLTVVRLPGRAYGQVMGTRGSRVTVEATAETRRVTTLPRWKAGDVVHLEPALRTGDAVGGHFVLGHVDGTGRVERLEQRGEAAWLTVSLSPALAAGLLPKGSIAVDGVSLTLDEGPFTGRFTVTLIPHTLDATRFRSLRPGEAVNLELDVLAKAARAAAHDRRAAVTRAADGDAPLTLGSLLARGWSRRS